MWIGNCMFAHFCPLEIKLIYEYNLWDIIIKKTNLYVCYEVILKTRESANGWLLY